MLRKNTADVDPSDIDEYILQAKDFKPQGSIISGTVWPEHVQNIFNEFTGLSEYVKDLLHIANEIVDSAASRALNPTMDHEASFIVPMITFMRYPYHEHRAIRSIMTYLVVLETESPHITKKEILEAVAKYQMPPNDIVRMPFGGWADLVYSVYEMCVEEADRMIAAGRSLQRLVALRAAPAHRALQLDLIEKALR
eukprot:5224275-Pleurochrysis_carterae.AAC.2